MLAGAAHEAGVQVIDEVPPDASLTVRADRRRLKQIVSNLLSNAIKYNRAGGWVRLRATAAGARVELAVADSGSGIDATQRARLFQPFERLGAQHGPVAGTGLGLALSAPARRGDGRLDRGREHAGRGFDLPRARCRPPEAGPGPAQRCSKRNTATLAQQVGPAPHHPPGLQAEAVGDREAASCAPAPRSRRRCRRGCSACRTTGRAAPWSPACARRARAAGSASARSWGS